MTPKSSLDSEMVKTMLYLERYQPDSLLLIEENLLKAQKNILNFVGTTENQQKIKTFINQEMNVAFDGLDEEVIKDVREITGTTWDSMGSLMAQGFVTDKLVNSFKDFKNVSNAVKDKLVNPNNLVQGHTLNDHFKHINSTTTRNIQGQILDGFNKGSGIQEISRGIRNTIGGVNRNQVNTLVTTALLESIEASKNESLKFFDKEILGWKYSSVMDTRTSKVCFINNNIRHKTQEEFKVKPKNHYRCRSMFMPITEMSEEFDKMFPDKQVVEWDGKTVNHRDGTKSTKFKVGEIKTVPKNASAETFFKSYDAKYQRDYMGAKRYDLWKSGRMSFDEAFNVSRKKLLPMSDVKAKVLPKAVVPNNHHINTLASATKADAQLKFNAFGSKVVNLKLDKGVIDGLSDGLNDVLGKYKNSGIVAKIERSKTSMAAFEGNVLYRDTKYQSFKFKEDSMLEEMALALNPEKAGLTKNFINKKILVATNEAERLALKSVNTGTVAHLARNEYEFARMATNHEAWHKIDLDNKLRVPFVSKLKEANITLAEKAKVSYYSMIGGDGELFAEIGSLYVSGRRDLIPDKLLAIFEDTIKGL